MTQVAKVRNTPAQTGKEAANLLMAEYNDLAKKKKKLDAKYKQGKQELEHEMTLLEERLHQYASENLDEFEDKKTLNLEDGTIGWRRLPGRLNFELEADPKAFEALIKKKYPDAVEEKVNTATVIKLGKTLAKLRQELAAIGVTIEQEDKFFVTPNL